MRESRRGKRKESFKELSSLRLAVEVESEAKIRAGVALRLQDSDFRNFMPRTKNGIQRSRVTGITTRIVQTFPRRCLANPQDCFFAVVSCVLSSVGPFTVVAPDVRHGKSNNATCGSRLIYSRGYPLERLSTCKARLVICSHLDRIGLCCGAFDVLLPRDALISFPRFHFRPRAISTLSQSALISIS